ncbi:MAG: molybdopterin-dependent oxidoreductase [Bacteroidetes bacterium]|nr:molybdopterin-dependent oxidoreductase [Bacteroidota bacterium]
MQAYDESRRHFLRLAGGAVVGFMIVQVTGCESNSVEPLTTGADVPFLTPNSSFYYKNGAEGSIARWTMPVIDSGTWRLAIDGLVQTPLSVSYQDIIDEESRSGIKLLKTMRCVIDSNEVQGLIGTAVWTGVPLRTFLDRAGIQTAQAKRLRFYGADTFGNNIQIGRIYGAPVPDLVEPLLVTHMNGSPLPAQHGFPVRLILHEGYGYKNVKWLTRVEVTANDLPFGTYQDEGFVDDGVMRVNSRMTNPLTNAQVAAGTIKCVGFAVSGASGIGTVEISVDGGPFAPVVIRSQDTVMATDAQLASTVQALNPTQFPYPFRAVWAQWEFSTSLTAGPHTISIRATDQAGNVQPESDDDISDGINAIPTVHITAV